MDNKNKVNKNEEYENNEHKDSGDDSDSDVGFNYHYPCQKIMINLILFFAMI